MAVGVILNITPQIDENDIVTLNIRPTISRIREFVSDPGVTIIAQRLIDAGAAAAIQNLVPVVQVREMETTLKVRSGQIAVLGGLMQDNNVRNTDQVLSMCLVKRSRSTIETTSSRSLSYSCARGSFEIRM